jgi:hypothetical protein
MCSTVYTGNVSSCCFSSRPTLPRTVKIVGGPAKGLASGVAPSGGDGSRMGVAHRVEFEYEVGAAITSSGRMILTGWRSGFWELDSSSDWRH